MHEKRIVLGRRHLGEREARLEPRLRLAGLLKHGLAFRVFQKRDRQLVLRRSAFHLSLVELFAQLLVALRRLAHQRVAALGEFLDLVVEHLHKLSLHLRLLVLHHNVGSDAQALELSLGVERRLLDRLSPSLRFLLGKLMKMLEDLRRCALKS